jgi:hypothetical protein
MAAKPMVATARKSAAPHHEIPVWVKPFHFRGSTHRVRLVLNPQADLRRDEATATMWPTPPK